MDTTLPAGAETAFAGVPIVVGSPKPYKPGFGLPEGFRVGFRV